MAELDQPFRFPVGALPKRAQELILEHLSGKKFLTGELPRVVLPELQVLRTTASDARINFTKIDWQTLSQYSVFQYLVRKLRARVKCVFLEHDVPPYRVLNHLTNWLGHVERLTLTSPSPETLMALYYYHPLRQLQIRYAEARAIASLPDILGTIPNISTLELLGCFGLTGEFFANLRRSCRGITTLYVESFSHWTVQDLCETSGGTAPMDCLPLEAIVEISNFDRLQSLRIAGEIHGFFSLSQAFSRMESLVCLDVSPNCTNVGGIGALLSAATSLRFLRLQNADVEDLASLGMLESLQLPSSLRTLRLRGRVTQRHLYMLANASSLVHLKVCTSDFSETEATFVAQFPFLNTLSIKARMSYDAFCELTKCPSLEYLEVSKIVINAPIERHQIVAPETAFGGTIDDREILTNFNVGRALTEILLETAELAWFNVDQIESGRGVYEPAQTKAWLANMNQALSRRRRQNGRAPFVPPEGLTVFDSWQDAFRGGGIPA